MDMRGFAAAAVVAALLASTASASGVCKPARYQIMGLVTDSGGQPLIDARVYLLLDQLSEDKTAEHGVRAMSVRTNASGSYVLLIDCDALALAGDRPSPCARSPKHLTVSAGAAGHRTRMQVFKLKSLEIRKDAGGCVVLVPDIRLTAGS